MTTLVIPELQDGTSEHGSSESAGTATSSKASRNATPLVTIIVPTLNERDNVHDLVRRLGEVLEGVDWEVIFVDDDSPDGTATAVRELGRELRQVRCVQRIGRKGLSTACIEGMLASSAPYLALMDGDLQHDPTVLRKMIDVLEEGEAELVVGSRYVDGGSCGNFPRRRQQISRLGTALGRSLLNTDVKDPMSTFFALRRDLLDEVVHGLSGLSFKILLDILLTIRRPVRFREIPFVLGERQAGESKLDASVVWEYLLLLTDKTVGRYVPLQFVSPAIIGVIGATVLLTSVLVLHGLVGVNFVTAEIIASALSMAFKYAVNTLGKRRELHTRWGLWIGKMISFAIVCGVGAAANVILAGYLVGRGTEWFASAIAGVLIWVAWNCAAANYSLGVKSA